MTDVSGIPNMGFGGGSYFGGNAATGQPAWSAADVNRSIWGNYSPQQAQSTLANIYGPMGFGGQTAMYAGLGAAAGRATGGFGGAPGRVGTIGNPGTSNPGYLTGGAAAANPYAAFLARYGQNPASSLPASPSGSVESGGAPPAIPWQNPFQQQPQAQSGRGDLAQIMSSGRGGIGSDAAASAAARLAAYQQAFRMPSANPSYFNPGTYGGDQGSFGIPYRGASMPGDIGFSKQPTMPNLGYNPGMQNLFANPGMNANPFQNRFGLGFGGQAPTMRPDYSSNPLTPTDIYSAPWRNPFGDNSAAGGG